jgi:hypothetical protein
LARRLDPKISVRAIVVRNAELDSSQAEVALDGNRTVSTGGPAEFVSPTIGDANLADDR